MRHKWILLFVGLLIAACTAPMRGAVSQERLPEQTVEITALPSISPAPTPTPSPTASPVPSATVSPTLEPTAEIVPTSEPTSDIGEPLFTMNLYHKDAFVRQKTNYWCVSASTQIMLNIIKGSADNSYETQLAISKVAWANIKYTGFAQSVYGSDPQGWVAALESFGGGDYEWVNSKSFNAALKSSVKAMAVTGRPVGLLAMSGGHAWVLNGFIATANPAVTDDFEVLNVYVTAPGYGLFKYDLKPNTKFSIKYLKTRLLKYHSKLTEEVWEGYYVTVQPVQ